MIDKAIAKITEEMMNENSALAQFIEEHLTEKCVNEAVAEKLLAEDKSLKGLIKEITSKARENAKNGVGCISDADVIAMTDEYFGLKEETIRPSAAKLDVLDFM